MSRPFDSKCSKLLNFDLDRIIAAIRTVGRHPQARNGGKFCQVDRQ
jgi:hypothetical protein